MGSVTIANDERSECVSLKKGLSPQQSSVESMQQKKRQASAADSDETREQKKRRITDGMSIPVEACSTISVESFQEKDAVLDESVNAYFAGPSKDGIEKCADEDVLSGRGGGTNLHTGNRHYRDLILSHRHTYDEVSKSKKPGIARNIVEIVRDRGGRFLRRDTDGFFYDIGDIAAREKTSQALRHRTFEMRNKNDPNRRKGDNKNGHIETCRASFSPRNIASIAHRKTTIKGGSDALLVGAAGMGQRIEQEPTSGLDIPLGNNTENSRLSTQTGRSGYPELLYQDLLLVRWRQYQQVVIEAERNRCQEESAYLQARLYASRQQEGARMGTDRGIPHPQFSSSSSSFLAPSSSMMVSNTGVGLVPNDDSLLPRCSSRSMATPYHSVRGLPASQHDKVLYLGMIGRSGRATPRNISRTNSLQQIYSHVPSTSASSLRVGGNASSGQRGFHGGLQL